MRNQPGEMGTPIFALDIGTKSVIGVLGTRGENGIVIQHSAMAYHKTRAMFDGQIHNIDEVAAIAKGIKETLEKESGIPLREVALAAAGRSLITHRLVIEKEIDENRMIDRHTVASIEIEGLQRAQQALIEQSTEYKDYYCVGHTVINYYVNDSLITHPAGHRGSRLKLDILATFLPMGVVDSLHTVMGKIGLEVNYMTLEPIAAMTVAIPQNIRLLNVALVDIGAGTSDIAITRDGTVIGYGMTATAGDEITEAIARELLLDFDSAEQLKCNLSKEEVHTITDIVGITQEITTQEILDRIRPALETTAKEIADSILLQNGKAPSAVFLVGGGSQIPMLREYIADFLQMPRERVVVKGVEMIQNLQHQGFQACGPEGITPVGILAKALENLAQDFIEINVNGQDIKMFQSKELKVRDALVAIGYNPRDLIPKRGNSVTVLINRQEKTFYGAYGMPAEIYINQQVASLETPIQDGDRIFVKAARMGADATPTFGELDLLHKKLIVNGQEVDQNLEFRLNGEPIQGDPCLRDGDEILYRSIRTLEDLARELNLDLTQLQVWVNGRRADAMTSLHPGDEIHYEPLGTIQKEAPQEAVQEVSIQEKALEVEGLVEEPLPVQGLEEEGLQEVAAAAEAFIQVECNGQKIAIPKGKLQPIFVDIFDYVDFDRHKVLGKLVLLHNGEPANFTAPLQDGDRLELRWD